MFRHTKKNPGTIINNQQSTETSWVVTGIIFSECKFKKNLRELDVLFLSNKLEKINNDYNILNVINVR